MKYQLNSEKYQRFQVSKYLKVNRALLYLHEGSLKITVTILLMYKIYLPV